MHGTHSTQVKVRVVGARHAHMRAHARAMPPENPRQLISLSRGIVGSSLVGNPRPSKLCQDGVHIDVAGPSRAPPGRALLGGLVQRTHHWVAASSQLLLLHIPTGSKAATGKGPMVQQSYNSVAEEGLPQNQYEQNIKRNGNRTWRSSSSNASKEMRLSCQVSSHRSMLRSHRAAMAQCSRSRGDGLRVGCGNRSPLQIVSHNYCSYGQRSAVVTGVHCNSPDTVGAVLNVNRYCT